MAGVAKPAGSMSVKQPCIIVRLRQIGDSCF